jgi:hypothetical protein
MNTTPKAPTTKDEKTFTQISEQIRQRLMGDPSDSDLRLMQLRMDVLNQWARLGPDAASGHDHDHMDDHDHVASAMILPTAEIASTLRQGAIERGELR